MLFFYALQVGHPSNCRFRGGPLARRATLFRKPIGMAFLTFRFYLKVMKFLNFKIINSQVLLKSSEIP
jgi:hypothetical protein